MMSRWVAAVVVSATVMGAASGAGARVMTATYTGTVSAGEDLTGEFGLLGDMAGQSFVGIFKFDPGLAGIHDIFPGHAENAYGGDYYEPGLGSPIVDATLTINGITRHFGEGYGEGVLYGQASTNTHRGSELVGVTVPSDVIGWNTLPFYDDNSLGLVATFPSMASPWSLYTNVPPRATLGSFGGFNIHHWDGSTLTHDAAATLVTQFYEVTGGVPEPATWTILLGGFFAMGAVLRQRRRNGAADAVSR
jgi:hypothetical protein